MGGLRLLLALMVVIQHLEFRLPLFDPRFAVQMFFLISGFYMAMVWNERYRHYKSPVRSFYVSRALRIYPVYFIVLLATIPIAWYGLIQGYESPLFAPIDAPLTGWAWILVYAPQITLFGMDLQGFAHRLADGTLQLTSNVRNHPLPWIVHYQFVPQAWTLACELTFYLIVPFAILRWKVAAGLFFLSILSRAIFWAYSSPQETLGTAFFPFELALFLAGSLSYTIWTHLKEKVLKAFSSRLSVALVAMSPVLMALSFNVIHNKLGEAAYWVCYAYAALTIPLLFEWSKHAALDKQFGELSFPVYISHFLVIDALLSVGIDRPPIQVLLFTFLLSILLAAIQRKIDAYRTSLNRKAAVL
ncbi:acyltransferase [Polaromonas sp. JS666]|uniref:acyltransferase family protein n=1 Tax=Polaromonas sp. (strain JS666 / ATCC BAA-500) TaxID=296591 RepID=UPI00087FAD0C|nr:acyltransferase [Polaromonas sp. JS666]SDN26427.1 Peptidoglycan/LPS O-acetylase OafA/YrhL, contains acyltransferase and SGNH-hydrolase domains [Polaromonas sp. JS666]